MARRHTPQAGLMTAVAALFAGAFGCQGVVDGVGGGSGSGNSGGGPTTAPLCTGEVVVPKRLVRLTFNQVQASVSSLLGSAAGSMIATTYEIGDLKQRTFPPLLSAREGANITEVQWNKGDGVAQASGKYVLDNFATVTGCGATPTEACGHDYLLKLAERAFRRPLVDQERTRLAQLETETKAAGATVQEAVQYGVYAILEAPQFLYRTELGTDANQDGALAPYELASQLAFFLTDAPPDQQLLDAAARGGLATSADIEAQATRLLGTAGAQANFEAAMFAYFSLPNLDTIVIDQARVPEWGDGLRNSMYHESELFLRDVLWNAPLGDLLVSRRTTINAALASLYGVAFPPAGSTPGADGFATATLPDVRAGLLTQAGFLTSRARPDQQSVVGRGLLVNASLLCAQNPAFPESLQATIAMVSATLENATEKQKADYRASNAPCMTCHPNFDPYGLVLESFDLIGKYRTMDAQGRPIDTNVKLPAAAGGAMISSARQLAEELAGDGAFARCMAKNLIGFALADRAVGVSDCPTDAVVRRYQAGSDKGFGALLTEIAVSNTLSQRTRGGAQ